MKKPKTLKEVNIPTHTRKNDGGVVSTVRQHFATREVNLKNISDFNKKASEVRSTLFDGNKLKVSYEVAEKEVIDLYSSIPNNGVDKADIRQEDTIGKLFNGMTSYKNYEDSKLSDIFTYNADENPNIKHHILNILTHPDFISGTIERMSNIRKTMEDKLGIKTEMIDPFSFKFTAEMDRETNSQDIMNTLMDKKIVEKLFNVANENHNILGKNHFIDVDSLSSLLYSFSKSNLLNHRKSSTSFIPSLTIKSLMNSGMIDIGSAKNMSWELQKNIINTIKPDYYNAPLTDEPAKLRKNMSNSISKSKEIPDEEKKSTIDFLNKVEDKHLAAAALIMKDVGIIPQFMSTDKKLMDGVQKISEQIKGVLNNIKPEHIKRDVYCSKNPLAILTMSPVKHVSSCQSLYDGEGNLHIGGIFRINIPATVNSHRINDFIMYTTNKEGEKTSRISLGSIEKDKLTHFESGGVFGDDYAGATLLREILSTNKNVISEKHKTPQFSDLNSDEVDIKEFAKKGSDLYKQLESSLSKISSKKEVNSIVDKAILTLTQESQPLRKKYGQLYSDTLSKNLTQYPTMLYGSDMMTRMNRLTSYLESVHRDIYQPIYDLGNLKHWDIDDK